MKLGAVQFRPDPGQIEKNILKHLYVVDLAIENDIEFIIFPELSLTGYEPTLAKTLAFDPTDQRLNPFQKVSDSAGITIAVGLPIKSNDVNLIGQLIFIPHRKPLLNTKQYLHEDEAPFFNCGKNITPLSIGEWRVGLAICFEISLPDHAINAKKLGADFYMASVAKNTEGLRKAKKTLSTTASNLKMTVMMANYAGIADGELCPGGTAVWGTNGEMIGELGDTEEAILSYHTNSNTTYKIEIQERLTGN